MSLLILDNRDSFTYNLVDSFRAIGVPNIRVVKAQDLNQSLMETYSKIVLGPGPGLPEEFPAMRWIFDRAGTGQHILGICLGHQAIAGYFGAHLLHLEQVIHGEALPVFIEDKQDPLFHAVPSPFKAGLYHSWSIDPRNLPGELQIIARLESGTIMGVRHSSRPITGLQFHPESYMTTVGRKILHNWYF